MILVTYKSYVSTCPVSHADRVVCVEFTEDIPSSGLHLSIAGSLSEYLPLLGKYDTARVANEAAATKVAQDSDRVNEASAAFGDTFLGWGRKIDAVHDIKDYAANALKSKLGDQSFSVFLKNPDPAKVARMVTVFAHVAETPSLLGSPETFQALKDATAALKVALGDLGRSRSLRTKQVRGLAKASRAFDSAYGALVRNIRRYDPEGLALLVPLFHRVRKVKVAVATPTPPAPPTPPATPEVPATPSEGSEAEAAK